MNKKKIIILSLLIIPIVIGCILIYILIPANNTKVEILINNEVYGTYSLYQDQTIIVENKEDRNVVEIKNGKVSVTESNCANQICVNASAISNDNPSTIICMPHHLVVQLK